MRSWPFKLLYRLVLKPLLFYILLSWLFSSYFERWWHHALAFAVLVLLLNSRPGRGLEEAGARGAVESFNWLRAGLVDGLLRLIVQAFKAVTDGVEYVLYTVDEWLRFRGGDSRLSMVVRVALGVIWFPVSYLARLYVVVLIEPGINPLKAPVSIAAAKFVYPIIIALGVYEYVNGLPLVWWALVWGTLWLLPDAFGFLIWEMKENWKLYRANRPAALEPAAVGPSGETMLRLLKPGFHSGTIPKLFAHLRRAERQALDTGAWRSARAVRQRLATVEESVRRFVSRDALALLQLSPEWHGKPLTVGGVHLASNQVRVELRHAEYPDTPLRLAIAVEDGLLVASVEEPGWLGRLTPAEALTLNQAMAGMYKLAGVDLVRQAPEPAYEPGPVDTRFEHAEHAQGLLSNGALKASCGALAFRGVTLTWAQWVDWWRHDGNGDRVSPSVQVLPRAEPAGGA
jgi:hypothetical protein